MKGWLHLTNFRHWDLNPGPLLSSRSSSTKINSSFSKMHLSTDAKDFFAIRTCYKCHFSCTCTAQLDPDHTVCDDPKNCLCERGRLSSNSKVFYLSSHDQFVSVAALSAPVNRQSLMVCYVYIRPVHNIRKKLVILLRGRAG